MTMQTQAVAAEAAIEEDEAIAHDGPIEAWAR